jgi:hypothetical protein
MKSISRRNFVKTTLISAGGIIAAGQPIFSKPNGGIQQVYVPRMAVNPDIDNLRVVCGVNKSMITGEPAGWDMTSQNSVVNSTEVERTLDALVVSLTKKENASDAWRTIFRKPENKNWDSVKVALKVNCIGKNHPRIAVVNKCCTELNKLGVKYENMYIYDGTHNAGPLYSPFIGKGLPAGVIIGEKNNALGGTVPLEIQEKKGLKSYKCTKMIAEGAIDILVNIALNKSHDKSVGGTTMTLKNHAGTFEPFRIHTGGGLDYILGFSKSNALWGGNPVRQQLCIIDSLWGSVKGGPFNPPDTRLDCLIMGTFSGAVDYLTAKKIREPLMGAVHGPIDRFVTDFGYEEKELTGWEMITL